MTDTRTFLFLQGPQSPFFLALGKALRAAGQRVIKINFCGGDLAHWPDPAAQCYRKSYEDWPACVANLMDREGVTDVLLFGDWRPLHREAITMAEQRGITVHVLEEGYWRAGFITLEEGGVNGRSRLPRSPEAVRAMAATLEAPPVTRALGNPLKSRVWDAVLHHVGNTVLWPVFFHYRTHRPYPIWWELKGWIPRYLTRRQRRTGSVRRLAKFYHGKHPFFLFPLQLDSDSQVTRYSPFRGMAEAIVHVLTNFAAHAPLETCLLIKNHPLDNGLVRYDTLVTSCAKALGIAERVTFIEDGRTPGMIARCQGVVLLNSTVGLSALEQGKPVYCLGQAVYAMPGLARGGMLPPLRDENSQTAYTASDTLAQFWGEPGEPDAALLDDFLKVLRHKALLPGNFYSPEGIDQAVTACLQRWGTV